MQQSRGIFTGPMSTFTDPATLTASQLESGEVFAPRFDSAGLVSAIAVEAGSNRVLMLAHMNEAALAMTLETGEVHYYSRSRGRLWKNWRRKKTPNTPERPGAITP